MRTDVVTPYYREPRKWLQRYLGSVRQQSVSCDHIVVADGHPEDGLYATDVRHVRLDRTHSNYGNTPRSMAAQLALSEGYDAIALLDGITGTNASTSSFVHGSLRL